jgi:hypothetical protein
MTGQPAAALLHPESGLLVEPSEGRVWRPGGAPAGKQYTDGYLRIFERTRPRSCKTWYVHRLVWEVLHGPIPAGMEIDHLDANPANNRINNLQLVTGQQNRLLQRERNLARYGSKSAAAKLTATEIGAVLRDARNVPHVVWARRLGVSPAAIRRIRKGASWGHMDRTPARLRKCP